MRAKLPRGTLDRLWSDPKNWQGYSFYYCAEDPRVIVPKRIKWGGWTLNFARRSAWVTLLAIILVPGVFVFLLKWKVAFWIVPGLIFMSLFSVAASIFLSRTDRYEQNR